MLGISTQFFQNKKTSINILLFALIATSAFSPNDTVSNLFHLSISPTLTVLSVKYVIDKKLSVIPHIVPAISFVFVWVYYAYDFLLKHDLIAANHSIALGLKWIEAVGLFGIGLYIIYMTKKHSELSAILLDILAIVFAVIVIALISNWGLVLDAYAAMDDIVTIDAICVVLVTYLFLVYFFQPLIRGLKDDNVMAQLTILTCTVALIHFICEVWIGVSYVHEEAPVILVRITRISYIVGGVFIYWLFQQMPHKVPSSELHSRFKEFSTPYSIILPFAAAVSLIAVPIHVIITTLKNYQIQIDYIVAIQAIVSLLFLLRFGILIKNLLSRTVELRHAAFHDQLTGVLNRRGLKRLYKTLQQRRMPNEHLCIAYIDINEFTEINNSYGHSAGDFVLEQLARSLTALKNTEIVARLGGDEFVVIFSYKQVPPYSSYELRSALNQWVEYGNHNIYLSISSGLTKVADSTLDSALENADVAMYSAKFNSTAKYKVDRREALKPHRQHIKELIQYVIENRCPQIYLQPIYSLKSRKIRAAEVLTRIMDKQGSLVMPNDYIPIARANQQLEAFENLVITQINDVINDIHCPIQLNLNPDIFSNIKATKKFNKFIKGINLPLDKVSFEITEKEHIDNDNLESNINFLYENGFRFALDDFGTGYSSLERVINFPIDCIKVDGSLLRAARLGNAAAVHAALSLAHHLGAVTTIECIESIDDIKLCNQLNGENAQGFYLCPPVPLEEFILKFDEIEYFNMPADNNVEGVDEKISLMH